MKVLAFGASSSKNSINKQFAEYAANVISDKVSLIDLSDFNLPIYSEDNEAEFGIPKSIIKLNQMIAETDIVLISFAEHNGSYTAAYKNIFDWLSRIDFDKKVFQGKRVIYLSTSIGEGGASSVLMQASESIKYFNGELIFKYSLPSFHNNFKDGLLIEGVRDSFEKHIKNSVKT